LGIHIPPKQKSDICRKKEEKEKEEEKEEDLEPRRDVYTPESSVSMLFSSAQSRQVLQTSFRIQLLATVSAMRS